MWCGTLVLILRPLTQTCGRVSSQSTQYYKCIPLLGNSLGFSILLFISPQVVSNALDNLLNINQRNLTLHGGAVLQSAEWLASTLVRPSLTNKTITTSATGVDQT